MKICCECKTFVWPWQHSSLAGGVIHATCHQKMLAEMAKDPMMRKMMQRELSEFQEKTGIKPNVAIP